MKIGDCNHGDIILLNGRRWRCMIRYGDAWGLARVEARARERYAAKGETFDSKGYSKPGWFQTPLREKKEDGTTSGQCWPIREIVKWSKTSRGGRQYELFAQQPEEEGCMRWGLCDQ